MHTQKSKNQLIRISVISLALLVLILIHFEQLSKSHSVCIHYYLLGFQCPLCGMTRAVHLFMHLQFVSALQYNAVVALLPLYLIVDFSTYFYPQNWLIVAKRVVVILIVAGLIALYAFRIACHFNWA
jgi:hypothetical protein